jgi:hypothetical protein
MKDLEQFSTQDYPALAMTFRIAAMAGVIVSAQIHVARLS